MREREKKKGDKIFVKRLQEKMRAEIINNIICLVVVVIVVIVVLKNNKRSGLGNYIEVILSAWPYHKQQQKLEQGVKDLV